MVPEKKRVGVVSVKTIDGHLGMISKVFNSCYFMAFSRSEQRQAGTAGARETHYWTDILHAGWLPPVLKILKFQLPTESCYLQSNIH